MADSISGRIYGPQYKLIGKNYVTADLFAKVTGKSKYAEDFRAEGMLFCKPLLSPLPHARVKPEALRRNAIVYFRTFLAETPEAPEAPAVWRETWRLLAGLPPSLSHFACTD
jgi:hypothetical protein